ncbi:MAG: hypothetical protein JO170_09410 [Verrucomicrobia bacterium]|nr:hypothetical protein [Verrucomicrobiota bacterium]
MVDLRPSAGLAVFGNDLFVSNGYANDTSGGIAEFDATTGKTINFNFVRGLPNPYGLAASGNCLFVALTGGVTPGAGAIGEYDATTGTAVNANLVPGLTEAYQLVVRVRAFALVDDRSRRRGYARVHAPQE